MSNPTTADDVPPPPYTVKEFENSIHEALLTPEVQNQFQMNVDGFTANTQNLAERFRVVKDKLEEIDGMKLDNELLAPTWAALRDRYIKSVTESEHIAAGIATGADKYLQIVVKPAASFHEKGEISSEDLEDLNVDIQDLLESNKKYEDAALKLKADFTGLISDVKTFRDKFVVKQNFGAVRQSENEAKIAELNIKVTELQKELDSINVDLKRAQDALLYGGIATGVLVTFTAWCPFVALAIFAAGALTAAGSGIAIAVYQNKAANKSAEIQQTKNSIKKYQEENDRIVAVRATLKALGENEISDVITGLEFFREIWAAIAVDCQTIGIYMADVQKRSSLMKEKDRKKAPASLVQYLKNSTTLYHGLSRGLYLYAQGIRAAKKAGHLPAQ